MNYHRFEAVPWLPWLSHSVRQSSRMGEHMAVTWTTGQSSHTAVTPGEEGLQTAGAFAFRMRTRAGAAKLQGYLTHKKTLTPL